MPTVLLLQATPPLPHMTPPPPITRLVSEGKTLGGRHRKPESELLVLGWGATEENRLADWLLKATVGG